MKGDMNHELRLIVVTTCPDLSVACPISDQSPMCFIDTNGMTVRLYILMHNATAA